MRVQHGIVLQDEALVSGDEISADEDEEDVATKEDLDFIDDADIMDEAFKFMRQARNADDRLYGATT